MSVGDPAIDQPRISAAVTSIIEAIGEDPCRAGLLRTPERMAEMYAEVFAGLSMDPLAELSRSFEEGHREMVILKDVPFYSMCEHHFLPFYGIAHLGYVPDDAGRGVGISSLARVVDILAHRPQIQERLTTQIAHTLMEALAPDGVAVVLQAEHLCMTMRGIKKPGSNVVTSATRGLFRRNAVTRSEFLALVQSK